MQQTNPKKVLAKKIEFTSKTLTFSLTYHQVNFCVIFIFIQYIIQINTKLNNFGERRLFNFVKEL